MDEFDLTDDDLFSDPVFEDILAQAESQFRTQTHSQHAPLQELDDSLLDDESLSQALAKIDQQPVTPSPSRYQNIAKSDEFEDSNLRSDGLLDALDRVTSSKKHALTPNETQSDKRSRISALQPVNFAQANRERPLAFKFKPWTEVAAVGDEDFGDPDFEDPDVLTALEDAEKRALVAQIPQSTEDTVHITRAELEAIKRNAFIAGQANHHRLWRKKYVFDFLKLPAGMIIRSSR
jgi:hypothetical protein